MSPAAGAPDDGTARRAAAARGIGTTYGGAATGFRVWAPHASHVELDLANRRVACAPEADGYFGVEVAGVAPGTAYRFSLDGSEPLPDPASRRQPDGVHGASAVVDPAFAWTDAPWTPPSLHDLVLYELHVGTFTPDGTFDAVVPRLASLRELGVTAIELMPVAAFPGRRNWGYDGVFPSAVQESYGGPDGLRRLVDAAHAGGLAVHLDVVYNHLGPEGSVLARYGPYFTDRHLTPWGRAINFDGPGSDEVRAFFIASALMYVREFHVDGLRLDAVHAIHDGSARPFLTELADAVRTASPAVLVVAESNLNDPRVIRPQDVGGLGLDAQWSDDLHHALHVALTGERSGYYADFAGVDDVARALRDGFVYTGQRSAFRGRRHGAPVTDRPPAQLVVASQNHDQVGNRANGDRIATLVPPAALTVAAATVVLAPYTPLLFMGEEYGESAPFLYFTDHGDASLVEAVRAGRRAEFGSFEWAGEPPDPQDPETFRRSVLDQRLADGGRHRQLRDVYRELLQLRRSLPALAPPRPRPRAALQGDAVVVLWRDRAACLVLGFGGAPSSVRLPAGRWRVAFDGADTRWGGTGATLPGLVEADGSRARTLPPYAALLLTARAQ
ncbi:MAG TPA: malto-oligosyltrehalose trehalohydrolase [Candidatus Limnocylindria bacterium]|nr:malto-oligosyltrehalose trehalohydrolase [Candidatus Limnocylindria bacterium]